MSDLDARTHEWYLQAEIETLYIRVSELKAENEKLDDTRIKYIGMINKLVDERSAQAKRIEDLEHHLNRAKKVLEPFAKQLAWKFGRYVGDLPIVAKSPHEEVKDEMTFKLYDFRMAHLIWEDIGKELGDKE